ncbi:DedA family protein [Brevibacillus sp. SYP-B805]|jgi:membrane-associated protein|uniref:DedA family protein n=1 Tax=Brevibacillus sp. SYP-B805 TaxID=1578199 RepID=UPI0013EDDAB7|nr:DedA family protein [Brevibacillus sp. SYP-B805]NGQ94456.1 DedA family protein [Brevibacillus sp. SYP-B805]
MDMNLLISVIEQYGYAAIFFLLWLGIVGLPIPDELVVATGGFLASVHILNPWYSFLSGYLGVMSGLTIGFLLGKWFGTPILRWLSKTKKMQRMIARSTELIKKYGTFSLCVSYLFPVVRHIVPYLVAMGGMKYRRYALLSYSIGLAWTTAFYVIGYLFGKNVESVIALIRSYGFYALGAMVVLIALGVFVRMKWANRPYKAQGE